MIDRATVAVGLGVLGVVSLTAWAFWPRKRGGFGGLSDHYQDQTAKFYVKKYGISQDDALKIVQSPRRTRIDREIEEWRAQYGYPDNNSPLVRGFVRDRIRALAGGFGLGRPRSNMLEVIASESRSPEEYAQRAEAWSSTEAKRPTISTIVATYRRQHPKARGAEIKRLLDAAKGMRIERTNERWRGYMSQPNESEDLVT